MQRISEVTADILASWGAAVEQWGEEGLEVVASPELADILGAPEYHRLFFFGEGEAKDSIYASYGSDYFRSLERLFYLRGRRAAVALGHVFVRSGKIAETLKDAIPLANATFRLEGIEETSLSYFLICFRFTALSDDRHDGMFSILVNPLNVSVALLENGLESLEGRVRPVAEEAPTAGEMEKILGCAQRAAEGIVEGRLKDFIRSAERRLNRDVKRVYEYYATLKGEIEGRIRKKAGQEGEMKHSAENIASVEIETLKHKSEAVEAELQGKIRDLIAKYSLVIHTTPLCILRIQATVPVFHIAIRRRLLSRPLTLAYNPLLKRVDALPCESCFHPVGTSMICDDKLHIVCNRCMAGSSASGKPLCPVCNAAG